MAGHNYMRDVYFVMSTVLLFVNCISHVVKTCIRRNCKSYPITTHKIVLTSSAMWLFDMLKNVMLSTVPGKKWSSKVSNLISVCFLGDNFIKIHADWTCIYRFIPLFFQME